MATPYIPLAVANTFIEIADNEQIDLPPMRLQKLMYFAHGWHLALKNAPLMCELVEAFPFGPAFRSIYEEFQFLGRAPIPAPSPQVVGGPIHIIIPLVTNESDSFIRALLERVWKVYVPHSEARLSIHLGRRNGPWQLARERGCRHLKDEEVAIEFLRVLKPPPG